MGFMYLSFARILSTSSQVAFEINHQNPVCAVCATCLTRQNCGMPTECICLLHVVLTEGAFAFRNAINRPTFVARMKFVCVPCEIRSESLYIIWMTFSLKRANLQRAPYMAEISKAL
jgi:hypothetical protein